MMSYRLQNVMGSYFQSEVSLSRPSFALCCDGRRWPRTVMLWRDWLWSTAINLIWLRRDALRVATLKIEENNDGDTMIGVVIDCITNKARLEADDVNGCSVLSIEGVKCLRTIRSVFTDIIFILFLCTYTFRHALLSCLVLCSVQSLLWRQALSLCFSPPKEKHRKSPFCCYFISIMDWKRTTYFHYLFYRR